MFLEYLGKFLNKCLFIVFCFAMCLVFSLFIPILVPMLLLNYCLTYYRISKACIGNIIKTSYESYIILYNKNQIYIIYGSENIVYFENKIKFVHYIYSKYHPLLEYTIIIRKSLASYFIDYDYDIETGLVLSKYIQFYTIIRVKIIQRAWRAYKLHKTILAAKIIQYHWLKHIYKPGGYFYKIASINWKN